MSTITQLGMLTGKAAAPTKQAGLGRKLMMQHFGTQGLLGSIGRGIGGTADAVGNLLSGRSGAVGAARNESNKYRAARDHLGPMLSSFEKAMWAAIGKTKLNPHVVSRQHAAKLKPAADAISGYSLLGGTLAGLAPAGQGLAEGVNGLLSNGQAKEAGVGRKMMIDLLGSKGLLGRVGRGIGGAADTVGNVLSGRSGAVFAANSNRKAVNHLKGFADMISPGSNVDPDNWDHLKELGKNINGMSRWYAKLQGEKAKNISRHTLLGGAGAGIGAAGAGLGAGIGSLFSGNKQ